MCSSLPIKRSRYEMMAPRPVKQRVLQSHGLFGLKFIRKHAMLEDRWTPNGICDQFAGMNKLLDRYNIYKKLERDAKRRSTNKRLHGIRRDVDTGRIQLNNVIYGDNSKLVHNILIHHKDLQRLYQKMPLHLAVDNINQRTFVKRKERDRLRRRLHLLKREFEMGLIERADIQNRLQFQNEFILDEELRQSEYRKKIENARVRLNAIQMMQHGFQEMLNILERDRIFHGRILESLTQDLEDQERLIQQILHIGKPALKNHHELIIRYRFIKQNFHDTLMENPLPKKKNVARVTFKGFQKKPIKQKIDMSYRFVRETESMLVLKREMTTLTKVIKEIQQATLSSCFHEIYPRIKQQAINNYVLQNNIDKSNIYLDHLNYMMANGDVLRGILLHNLSEEEIVRKGRIKELQDAIHREDEYTAEIILYLKNRADHYVLMRIYLWSIWEMLHQVDEHEHKSSTYRVCPNSYLCLPLLRFQMIQMRAVPPEMFEESLSVLMRRIKKKVEKLMEVYPKEVTGTELNEYRDIYHEHIIDDVQEAKELDESTENEVVYDDMEDEDDDIEARDEDVLDRLQMKQQSAKVVEEFQRKANE